MTGGGSGAVKACAWPIGTWDKTPFEGGADESSLR